MALDPSIFAQFLRPVKSVADYDREAIDLDNARASQQANALQLMAGRQRLAEQDRAAQEGNRLRSLAQGWGADTTEDQRINALKNAGFFSQADALEKGSLERLKAGADVESKKATTKKALGEAQDAALKRYRGALDFIDTPEGAARWMQAQYADPDIAQQMAALGSPEQAISRIPSDPAAFQQWRQQAALGMEKFMQENRMQAADAETRRRNVATESLTRSGQELTRRGQDQPQFVPVEGVGLFVGDRRTGTARPVTTEGGAPIVPKKPPPQFAIEGAQKAVGAMSTIDSALESIETPTGKKALGLKNMAPGAIGRAAVDALDPDGVETRAAVAEIGSAQIKDRSGATVTIGEEPRLMPFIPVPTDSPDVAKKKLKRLRQIIQQDYELLGEFYPGVKDKGAAPTPAAGGFTYIGKE